ncbi:MAG: type VI secretion system protein ImpG [Anaeromyxobacter sp. RBG_16_69_14]|nr:MAG: type VI secretion system protein ImpG [Anaeromyxobacter sp. RBG_16_69_14]
MDTRLLRLYNRELQFVRELGSEFAREFPKIAGRLGLEGLECADPYVERLIESFAFLAARVQLKLEAQFPRFTQYLLEMVYPQYLSPTPSMAVVELKPGASDAARLEAGFEVPRGSALRGLLGRDLQTACEYRTSHRTTLWPIELRHAAYSAGSGEATPRADGRPASQATLRLRLAAVGGVKLHTLALDRLPLYLYGEPELTSRLYEQLSGHVVGAFGRPAQERPAWREGLAGELVRAMGFEDEEALLPAGARSFQGYRLLHEYFAFPARFLFVELCGLAPAVRRCVGGELELVYLLDACDRSLAGSVNASHLRLFCTPAVNLFPHSADRIHLTDAAGEHHVVPDRSRPLDFEVHSVRQVVGNASGVEARRSFLPFYAPGDESADAEQGSYFTVRREPRLPSANPRAGGPRSSYPGSEIFISLVDGEEGPFGPDLKQLSVDTLCTNRDLPLLMPVGTGRTDFHLESGAPVESVRCLAGPTPPRPSHPQGEASWRLISHLSLNYLSITDGGKTKGAATLRELLGLYADLADPAVAKQIEGVASVSSRPAIHRLPLAGPIAFARGLEIVVTCDESAFEGTGVMRLGAVLERFFTRYVSINTATETVFRTIQRGEIRRWPARIGSRHVL